jgi:hypothetical protein
VAFRADTRLLDEAPTFEYSGGKRVCGEACRPYGTNQFSRRLFSPCAACVQGLKSPRAEHPTVGYRRSSCHAADAYANADR